MSKTANLMPRETIILALLMLRGPQTPGALRGRAERVYAFKNLEAVHEVLGNLSEWGFIRQLPRQAGHKELCYVHLFSGASADDIDPGPSSGIESEAASGLAKIEALEAQVQALRCALEQLKTAFLDFKNQY